MLLLTILLASAIEIFSTAIMLIITPVYNGTVACCGSVFTLAVDTLGGLLLKMAIAVYLTMCLFSPQYKHLGVLLHDYY